MREASRPTRLGQTFCRAGRERIRQRIACFDAEREHGVVRCGRRGVEHHHGFHDAPVDERPHRLERSRIGAFGKHDPAAPGGGARLQVGEKGHLRTAAAAAARSRNAAATAGWTRLDNSPPYRAISRTRLALMYVVSSDGTMNTVSSFGDR